MKLNRYLITEGAETAVVGFYFALQEQLLRDDPHQPIVHLLHSLGSPYWSAFMAVIGLVAILVGLLVCKHMWIEHVALALLAAIWLIYTVAFISQDIDFGNIKLTSIFMAFTFIFIVTQAGGGSQ